MTLDGLHDTRVFRRAAPTAAVLTRHPLPRCSRACSTIVAVAPTTAGREPSDLVPPFFESSFRLGMDSITLYDGQLDGDLDLAIVLGAKVGRSLRRALRIVRGRAEKRPIGGSRRGCRPKRKRGFDMGAQRTLRDEFGLAGSRRSTLSSILKSATACRAPSSSGSTRPLATSLCGSAPSTIPGACSPIPSRSWQRRCAVWVMERPTTDQASPDACRALRISRPPGA